MKPSEAMQPFAELPNKEGWIAHTAEHVANLRNAIPIAQAMEAVVEAAQKVAKRWDMYGLGSGDEKILNDLSTAYSNLESLQQGENQ